jgi:putative transposase
MPWLRRCRRRRVGIGAEWRHALVGHRWPRPAAAHRTGTGPDWARTRGPLLAENALVRQQRLVVHHSVTRPTLTPADRARLMLRAGRVRAWRHALLIVRPETLLGWHRAGLRSCWRRQSRPGPGRPPLAAETIVLIWRMAAENPLWGAERIRGERGKAGIRVAKRTIQTYRRGHRAPRPRGQTWATFLRNHAPDSWACDFLPVTDLLFRPRCACFIIEQATRRVVHVGATRHPTDAWVAQQLREATPFGQRPRYLIRENDGKCGAAFASVAAASGITILRTPPRAPQANAVCERFLGRVRRACLDHLLVLGERQRSRVLREYVAYCNRARPHQGLGQALPEPPPEKPERCAGPMRAVPVLGGLHHTYQRAA